MTDGRVLAFTLGSVVAGALIGLVAAVQSTRPDLAGALRSESAGGGRPGQLWWRNALVITQLTISLVLLVGPFLRSSRQVQSVDPGFGREPTAIMTFLTSATRFTPDAARVYTAPPARPLPRAARRGCGRRPQRPCTGTRSTRAQRLRRRPVRAWTDHGAFIADWVAVAPGSSRRRASRSSAGATSTADRPATQPVVIISEAMARRSSTDGDAVGRRVRPRHDAAACLEGRRTSHDGRVGLAGELSARAASTHAVPLAGGWKGSAMVVRHVALCRLRRRRRQPLPTLKGPMPAGVAHVNGGSATGS